MASVFDKVLILLGVRDEEDEPGKVKEKADSLPLQKRHEPRGTRRTNLVSLDGGVKKVRIMVIEPNEFEEVRSYVDHLKNKHPLIVRLTHLDVDEARRIVDFMSGATYAIDGNMRKLGEMIFCFAPQSVVIEGELEASIFDLKEFEE